MLGWIDHNSYIKWSDDSYGEIYMPCPQNMPQIRYSNNESISLSEAGTEIGVITRLQKKTFTVTWIVNSDYYEQIERRCLKATSTLVFGEHSGMTVRARITAANLIKGSEWIRRTDGLWSITVQFIEV